MSRPNDRAASSGEQALILLVSGLVGLVLFLAFSFLTFGLPLIVVAVACLVWMYVGVMKLIDRGLSRRASAKSDASRETASH